MCDSSTVIARLNKEAEAISRFQGVSDKGIAAFSVIRNKKIGTGFLPGSLESRTLRIGEHKVKKIIIGLIFVFISILLVGTGAFAIDSVSNTVKKSADYGPAITNTDTPEDELDSSEQAASGGYSCELINDGSFENGPPAASAWTEWRNPGSESRILDPSDYFYCSGTSVYPHNGGDYSWWGAGYSDGNPVSNYVEQEITIPNDATQLSFYTVFFREDEDDPSPDDVFYVTVSGETVFERDMVQANDSCPDWVEQTVDISEYAGQTVTLRFEATSVGDITGNVLVDYIRVCNPLGRGLSAIFLLLLGD